MILSGSGRCSALDVVNGFRDRPAGTLRLNAPAVAARLVLPAIVPPFLAAYPDITLEVIAKDSFDARKNRALGNRRATGTPAPSPAAIASRANAPSRSG